MNKENELYLPFKAINLVMEPDYRKNILEFVLTHINDLPEEERNLMNAALLKYVKVKGFRNPKNAPLSMRLKEYIAKFEVESDLVEITLNTWASLKKKLFKEVKSMLELAKWDCLDLERDTKGGDQGFYSGWPKKSKLDKMYKSYQENYPKSKENIDDVALMITWISGYLPN